MGITRRSFTKGVMDKDTDERLVPDGFFRDAENILISQSEGSDVGAIENSYSNKELTNYNFGEGIVETLGSFCDELEDKIYWFVKSDTGCYLMEYDNINGITSPVLVDTRTAPDRVLDLNSNFLITGIAKIISEDTSEDLLLWTDDNMQPCCINVERAKTWATNGFVIEDLLLVKKPPRYAPVLTPTYVADLSNNMEEKFLSFCYRYKYNDGEYSALSTFTNYSFTPKPFDLDYYTLDNVGMVNAFNAVRIEINTGEKQVTDIQVCVKESNWNNIYVIETFNKKNLDWTDGIFKSFIFANNKIYTVLPIKELYRTFDNVPLKAKALTLIGNRAVYGNYLEGWDMLDNNGNKVVFDYEVSLINNEIEQGDSFTTVKALNTMTVTNPEQVELKEGYKLVFFINVQVDTNYDSYKNTFSYILPKDYATLQDVFDDELFTAFIPVIDNDFRLNYMFDFPENTNYVVEIPPVFEYILIGNIPTFGITPVTFKDTLNGDAIVVANFQFIVDSTVYITSESNSTSIKTNRDYEVGIIYEDKFNRKTTVFTSIYNTIYVSQEYSEYRNRIKVTLKHNAPSWADRYKIVVKAKPLQYQTIYIYRFYTEDFYTWCKLEAENKDKIIVGDTLILKKTAAGVAAIPLKVKVLALEEKVKDWIATGDDDADGNPIIQEAGYYMKIRPDKFSMDFDDYKIYQDKAKASELSGFPYAYLDLQTSIDLTDPQNPILTELPIPTGSSIYLNFRSERHYNAGVKNNIYEYTHYAQRDYDTLQDWFEETILNRTLKGNVGDESEDYNGSFEFVRGTKVVFFGDLSAFVIDPTKGLFLKIKGSYEGSNSGAWRPRYGRIFVEMVIRTNTGFYVFETLPKQADVEIYYETEQTFEILEGKNHDGNIQTQNVDTLDPAIIDLDFFNCYTMGNGIESYRIKDGFNTNYLNIDLKPTSTSVAEYKSVRRYADLTYSEPYVESTNINGLNEFNLSTANYKELDKQYGSIQKLHDRENDILVLQEELASKVMFGKDALYNGDGTVNVTSISQVLGQNIPYIGENGIGKNPESFAVNKYQIFYANIRKGLILRLSMDGVTEIVTGMVDWFRDLSITHPFSKKLGGYDPYLDQYVLSIDEQDVVVYNAVCGNVLVRTNQDAPFSYNLNLNELIGDVVLSYNITSGDATITALYNEILTTESNVTGTGTITIPRTTLNVDTILITIIPVSPLISFEIANACPLGTAMTVVSVVLNDETELSKTITNRYRWRSSPFYAENDLFDATPISRWTQETGIEGVGRMPSRGTTIRLESYKDNLATATFLQNQCNRLGYLISSTVYTQGTYAEMLGLATYLTLTETLDGLVNIINSGSFVFGKTSDDEILYLIWDYTDRMPIAVDDVKNINNGEATIINVLNNDTVSGTPLVTILTAPTHGTAVLNIDNTITYTHDGSYTEPPVDLGTTRIFEYGVTPLIVDSGLIAGSVAVGFNLPNAVTYTATEVLTLTIDIDNNYITTAEQPNFSLVVLPTINGAFVSVGIINLNIGDVLSVGYQIFGEGTVDGGGSWITYIDKENSALQSDTIVYEVSNGICSASALINIFIAHSPSEPTLYCPLFSDFSPSLASSIPMTKQLSGVYTSDTITYNGVDPISTSLRWYASGQSSYPVFPEASPYPNAISSSLTLTNGQTFQLSYYIGNQEDGFSVTVNAKLFDCELIVVVPPDPPAMISYSYEGFYELNDPLHPTGGSLSYVDINGITQNLTFMWSGNCIQFNSQSPPTNIIGAAPC